jgi:glutamine synthetase
MTPPPAINRNIYVMSEEERQANGIANLPAALNDALALLAKDEVVKGALGEHIYANFKEAKEIEFDVYRSTVHQWERDQYMKMY